MDLTDASALVTGGAGGFGSATARRLAQAGARVVIADVADERGEALARELGNGSCYVHTDMLDEDAIANAVRTATELGPLRATVVVHSGPPAPGGGASGMRTVDEDGKRLPLAHFAHYVNIFLTSAFAVTSRAAEAMAKNAPLASNQRGVIINTASTHGFGGLPGFTGYSAAKGGIITMALTVARDLAPLGIRSMAISPGRFYTFAHAGMTKEEADAKWGADIPNPSRMGDPDEYAALAAHIVQNDFLNGTTIRIDGAQHF